MASFTCLCDEADAKVAEKQLRNKLLDTPSNVPISTKKTMELKMNKLPPAAKVAFNVPALPHNILSGAELVDAGLKLHLDRYGA